ncbi:unnamed protein product, partial [Prorocentrum cordatum]
MPLLQTTIRGGKVEATKFASLRDERADYVDWRHCTVVEDADTQRGTYAADRCTGEDFSRMLDAPPAELGEAGGHAGLASERPMVFAGEVQINHRMELAAWTRVSGMHEIPNASVMQSGPPPDLPWRFLDREAVQCRGGAGQLHRLRGRHALEPPSARTSDGAIKRGCDLLRTSEGPRKAAEVPAASASVKSEAKQEVNTEMGLQRPSKGQRKAAKELEYMAPITKAASAAIPPPTGDADMLPQGRGRDAENIADVGRLRAFRHHCFCPCKSRATRGPPPANDLRDADAALIDRLRATLENWRELSLNVEVYHALLAVALNAAEIIPRRPENAMLTARLLHLTVIGATRARDTGAHSYRHGRWSRREGFSEKTLRGMEEVLQLASALFRHLRGDQVQRSWDSRFGSWELIHGEFLQQQPTTRRDFSIGRDAKEVWAAEAGRVLQEMGARINGEGRGAELLDAFGAHFENVTLTLAEDPDGGTR